MANYFVDFSAGVDGTGTFASPYNTIISKTFSASDFIWCRRKTLTLSSTYTISSPGTFVGWPKSGDVYYDTRPSEAQSAWDGDAPDYAEMVTTSVSAANAFTHSGASIWHRFRYVRPGSHNYGYSCVSPTANNAYYNCYFLAANSGNGQSIGTTTAGTYNFYDCIIGVTRSVSTVPEQCLYLNGAGIYMNFTDCTFQTEAGTTNVCSYLLYLNNRGNAYFRRCTFDITAAQPANGFVTVSNGQDNEYIIFDTCTFKSNSTELGLSGSKFVVYHNCTAIVPRITGAAVKCHILFNTVTQSTTTTGALIDIWGSRFVANNLTALNGNTYGTVRFPTGTSAFGKCECMLRNTTLDSSGTVYYNALGGGVLLIQDNAKSLGNWSKYTKAGIVEASTNVRTGGSDISLCIKPNNSAYSILGNSLYEYGLETIYVTLSAGANTITVYGQYSGWTTPPDKSNLIIESDYLDGSDAHRAWITSRSTGALTSDTSTWTNSGTSFKLVLSVTCGQACIAPIRIRSRRSSDGASSYIYIDPTPVVS